MTSVYVHYGVVLMLSLVTQFARGNAYEASITPADVEAISCVRGLAIHVDQTNRTYLDSLASLNGMLNSLDLNADVYRRRTDTGSYQLVALVKVSDPIESQDLIAAARGLYEAQADFFRDKPDDSILEKLEIKIEPVIERRYPASERPKMLDVFMFSFNMFFGLKSFLVAEAAGEAFGRAVEWGMIGMAVVQAASALNSMRKIALSVFPWMGRKRELLTYSAELNTTIEELAHTQTSAKGIVLLINSMPPTQTTYGKQSRKTMRELVIDLGYEFVSSLDTFMKVPESLR